MLLMLQQLMQQLSKGTLSHSHYTSPASTREVISVMWFNRNSTAIIDLLLGYHLLIQKDGLDAP